MRKEHYTPKDVLQILNIEDKITKQSLLNMEKRGEIPVAERIQRGKQQVRAWKRSDLVKIGGFLGNLEAPENTHLIVCFSGKGGVLKSTTSSILAKTIAVQTQAKENGDKVKVLYVGLDLQESGSRMLLGEEEYESLDEVTEPPLGLYHLLYEGAEIDEVIKEVEDVPNLFCIPEGPELSLLERRLRLETAKEQIFKKKLIPKLEKHFDVIIFDLSPSWSTLTENALASGTEKSFMHLVSPISTEVSAWQSLKPNIQTLNEFQESMEVIYDTYTVIPTLTDRSKLSQQIYSALMTRFDDDFLPYPIRRSVIGQEAQVLKETPIEYSPKSNLAEDWQITIQNLWKKILSVEKESN